MTAEYTSRELRNVTKLALQRLADDRHADADIRYRALAARAQLNREAKPDLREPYVYRVQVQPGLWLTVDASHNILLEVRTADEAELLAAYALSSTAEFRHLLDRAYSARNEAVDDAHAARLRGVADAEYGRRLAAGMGPGEDADSRASAVAELLKAGLPADSVYRVLKRAYGHQVITSFNVDWSPLLGTVAYDREHGTYAVRLPEPFYVTAQDGTVLECDPEHYEQVRAEGLGTQDTGAQAILAGTCCGKPGTDCTGPCGRSYDETGPADTTALAELTGPQPLSRQREHWLRTHPGQGRAHDPAREPDGERWEDRRDTRDGSADMADWWRSPAAADCGDAGRHRAHDFAGGTAWCEGIS